MFPRGYFAAAWFPPRYFPPAVVVALVGLAARMGLSSDGSGRSVFSASSRVRSVTASDPGASGTDRATGISSEPALSSGGGAPVIESARNIP